MPGFWRRFAGHAHDLAHRAPQYREAFPARTVVCGDRFTNEADVRDGPAAVARAGAAFVNMPEDKDARRSTVDGLADVLQEWTART